MRKGGQNNYAFIDSQNVNLAIREQGWILDWRRFRIYLKEKYGVSKAFLFLGYIYKNKSLYNFLRQAGYELVFKPTKQYKDDSVKGNVDAELVLQTMIEFENYEQALIITGDGDFYCLVKYLAGKKKLRKVLIPNKRCYSEFLREAVPNMGYIAFMNDLKKRLHYVK